MSTGTLADTPRDLAGSLGIIIEARMKPDRDREEVLVIGHSRVKSSARLDAADLTLRTIKAAVISPYRTQDRAGAQGVPYGSITQAGSLNNDVTIQIIKGTLKQANVPATGTAHIGTVQGGTMQVSFFLLGA